MTYGFEVSRRYWRPGVALLDSVLSEQGIDPEFSIGAGGHVEEYWIARTPDYLRFYSAQFADRQAALTSRASGAPDLFGVVVAVVGIDFEPIVERVGAALGVPAVAVPVFGAEAVQDGDGAFAGSAEGEKRGLDRARIVEQVVRVEDLVVAVKDGDVFGNQFAEAEGGGHLAVREVVDDLASGPTVGVGIIELGGGNAGEGGFDGGVAFAITADQFGASSGIHVESKVER